MVIDNHNHVWKGTPTGEGFLDTPMDIENLLREMDRCGVDKAGICSIAQDVQNDYVLEAQRLHPDRFIGYCFINPREKNAEETLRTYFGEGLRGLKLHPQLHGFPLHNVEFLAPLLELCREHKAHVFCHGSGGEIFNTPFQFEEIAREFPEIPLIIGHMGAVNMSDMAIKVAERNQNVYLDTSFTVLDNIRTAVRRLSHEKILLGTDWPGGDFALSQKMIDLSTEDSIEYRSRIKGENYARILGIDF